ncbi:MAG: hypothetical protein OXG46_01890 [Chloroflexi bacterium]|nr:hypothetical protein [Chloroflexota bacterium]MCY3937236.1 hypothetical protein [Chloroflexota bacterium]
MPKAPAGTVEQHHERHCDEGAGGDPLQQADSVRVRDGPGLRPLGITLQRCGYKVREAIKRGGWSLISVRGGHRIRAFRGRRVCNRRHQGERNEKD